MTFDDPRLVVNPTASKYLRDKYQPSTNPFFSMGAAKDGSDAGADSGGAKDVRVHYALGSLTWPHVYYLSGVFVRLCLIILRDVPLLLFPLFASISVFSVFESVLVSQLTHVEV